MEKKAHTSYQYPPIDEIDLADVNTTRRSFLKSMLFGGGFFMIGKIFGPSISLFSPSSDLGDITDFENFRVVENKKGLHFFDKVGNEILSLDKEL
jgi:hypothetical protein